MEDLVESVKDTILTIKQAAQRSRVHRSRIDAAIAGRELKFMKLSTGTRRIWAYDLEKWWRSKRAKDVSHRGEILGINSEQPIERTEPERLLTLAEAAKRCHIETSKLWSAHWSGQLGLVVLGPCSHRVLLSELSRWSRPQATPEREE
jgi:excisionase family DNA binding protein